ncbi:MAG: hypothetical protein JM57_04890 [Comamonadaceae bacterium BICA1-1]|nr:MAG: hypothetical protein JM57_04890 [Comamonadaceae bacterium BICA1-1]
MVARPAPLQLALLNHKGGTGKTTLAVNLAAALAQRAPTLLVDLDAQGSALQWAGQGGVPWPMRVQAQAAPPVQPAADGQQAAFVVWDCPPALDAPPVLALLEHLDWVLVPVLPSPVDLWASWHLVRLLQQASTGNPRLRAAFVINQAEPDSALTSAMHEALHEFGLPVLATVVRRRAIYRSAALGGQTVQMLGRRGAAAAAELEALIEEVLK